MVEVNNDMDWSVLSNILLKLNIPLDSVNIQRHGSSSNHNKTRPVLVNFSNKDDALYFFKNKKYLPKGTTAALDRTKQQRDTYNRMRNEMIRHNKSHPGKKKYIKFIEGKPTLVYVSSNNIDGQMNNQENYPDEALPAKCHNQPRPLPVVKETTGVTHNRFDNAVKNHRQLFNNKTKPNVSKNNMYSKINTDSVTNLSSANKVTSNNNNSNNNKFQISQNSENHILPTVIVANSQNAKRKRGRPTNSQSSNSSDLKTQKEP